MNPHLVWDHFALEMDVKIVYEFFKELSEYSEILHQQRELALKETRQAIEWNFLLRFLKDGVEEPEGLLLISARYTEYKANKEVHTLAVANFWFVYRVGFKNILQLGLAIFSEFFVLEEGERWKSTRNVLLDVISTGIVWLSSYF